MRTCGGYSSRDRMKSLKIPNPSLRHGDQSCGYFLPKGSLKGNKMYPFPWHIFSWSWGAVLAKVGERDLSVKQFWGK